MALLQTGVWPLETMFSGKFNEQKSLYEVFRGLEAFRYDPPNDTCSVCSADFDRNIERAVTDVENDFGGLCLNCMDDKKERNWELDNEYNKNGVPPKFREYISSNVY